MRNFRLLMTFTSLTAIAVGGLVACGDDDSSSSSSGGVTPGIDSGTSGATTSSSSSGSGTSSSGSTSSSGGTDSAPPKPTAAITAVSVYLGQTIALDGSASTGSGLSYTWTVAPPAGSSITNASIQNATSAKATFVPDKIGDYVVTLTVKSGSETSTANVTLKAVDVPVFFFAQDSNPSSNKNDRGTVRVSNVFGGDGDGGTEVACFEQDAGQTGVNGMDTKTVYGGEIWSDWWEAPAGNPSRAVFAWRTEEGGKHAGHLFGVTSAGTCATPPTSLDVVADAESNQDSVFELPRFSPNGQRVLYTKQATPGHVRITTVGFDGTGLHSVAERQVGSDGGTNPDAGRYGGPGFSAPGPRPVWIDDTNVAWITKDDNTDWQIIKASDADNATATVLMTCTGSLPTDLAVLPSGEILVAQQIAAPDANATATNIVGYTPDATTKKCGTPRNVTKMVSATGSSYSRGFTLSPDKSKLAYIAYDDGPNTVHAAVVPVDGSSPPVYVGNATTVAQAPRWIAGGTQLSWGTAANSVDGGGSGTAFVIAASPIDNDAGGHAIVKATSDRSYTAVSTSSACGIGYGFGSAVSGVGFLGLLGLGITRRRRRQS